MKITTAAYGLVLVGGLALFAYGHPAVEAPPSPTTPGFTAVAAAAPALSGPPAAAPKAAQAAAPAPSGTPTTLLAAAAPSVTGDGVTLTSLSVDLPSSDREFPLGPGVDVAQANCVACHSVGMVMNQPALSRATWETEVHKMIAVYKAPVTEDDAKTIVAYLDSIKGKE